MTGESRYCGRCRHPAFTHATNRCTAVDESIGAHNDVVETPCDCQATYASVAGDDR